MQSVAAVPSERRENSFYLIVSNLVSLIDHVQASLELIDAAMASQADSEQELGDVVLLDNVTPLYARAGDALELCNVTLRAALQFLLDAEAAGLATAPADLVLPREETRRAWILARATSSFRRRSSCRSAHHISLSRSLPDRRSSASSCYSP